MRGGGGGGVGRARGAGGGHPRVRQIRRSARRRGVMWYNRRQPRIRRSTDPIGRWGMGKRRTANVGPRPLGGPSCLSHWLSKCERDKRSQKDKAQKRAENRKRDKEANSSV